MFRCVFITYTLHTYDVCDEMLVMAIMVQVESLFKFFIMSPCILVMYHF